MGQLGGTGRDWDDLGGSLEGIGSDWDELLGYWEALGGTGKYWRILRGPWGVTGREMG